MKKRRRIVAPFYPLNKKDRISAFLEGFIICFAAIEIMFLNPFAAAAAGIAGGFVLKGVFLKRKTEKQKKVLLLQFRDWLDSLQGAVSSGSNINDAVCKSAADMLEMHGENSLIVRETALIRDGLNNSLRLSELVDNFAEGSGLEDIKSFADTLGACAELGGNLNEVIGISRAILCERISTEAEIQTYVASNKNELMIMSFMPFVTVTAMRIFGAGTVSSNGITDIAVKILALGIFVFSYCLGNRIIRVNM